MKTVIDIETTSFHNNPSPYIPENYLVSVGFKSEKYEEYLCFKHNDNPSDTTAKYLLSEQLRKTTLLKDYLRNGIGFESMPWDIVKEYGRNDVDITWLLYHKQKEEIDQAKKLSERIK